ncbi:unnamed protein product, partial [Meganyctiphanes norvegica]
TIVIKKLRAKNAMILCMVAYFPYMAAQFHPEIFTLVPSALLLGMAAAVLWTAQCTYFTQVSVKLSNLTGEDSDVILTRFFGIFFFFFQSTQIWGNLISSLVLSIGVTEKNNTNELSLLHCGIQFCPNDKVLEDEITSIPQEDRPPALHIYLIAGICLVCGGTAALVLAFFADPLTRYGEIEDKIKSPTSKKPTEKPTSQLIVATFHQMRHPYQILIMPLTLWSGAEQAFFASDFTSAYVTCSMGVHMVGYVMICYGVSDAICSNCFSPIVSRIGRVPVFTLAALINIGVIIYLTYWMPHPDDIHIYFILAALWGVGDAVWQSQINALYGIIFPGESVPAFSNYRLWESLGFFSNFAIGGMFCTSVKIIMVMGSLLAGMLGYYSVEMLERRGGPKRDKIGNVLPLDQVILQMFTGKK